MSPLIFSFNNESGTSKFEALERNVLNQVRYSELNNIANAHSCRALLTIEQGHFELPSGAHTSHFFRLADCLASAEDIDRLVYWIARDIYPLLHDQAIEPRLLLLVDNVSTLVLAVRTSQIFPDFDIRYECLPEYPETRQAIDELEEWIGTRIDDCTGIYCVISVSSTGSLKNALLESGRSIGLDVNFSTLFATTTEVTEAYCNFEIDGYLHYPNASTCELCKEGGRGGVFQIDRARYFLTERKLKEIRLPPQHFFVAQKTFIEKYGKCENVLRVHIDDPNDEESRHHAFYVDVISLIQIENFRGELYAKIASINPPPDLGNV